MIALVAIFALSGGTAQADTLVSNIGKSSQSAAANVTSSQSQAQAFTTGSWSRGYVLESVQVHVRNFSGTTSHISVSIYSEDGGEPVSVVQALSNPGTIGTGTQTFTAPENATLDASTTYFVVVSTSSSAIGISRTSSSSEDMGGATGWTIANNRLFGSGTSWTIASPASVLKIRLNGRIYTPPPPPEVVAGLSKPLNLRAKAVSMTQIDLSWSRPKTRQFRITGYKIEASRNGYSWGVLEANTSSTSTRYSHTGLRAGHGWYHRVSAINEKGTGPASNEAFATTTTPPPSVPETVVPSTWSLIPPGLGPGDKFRLLFVTATNRQARSSDIEDYNGFVQAAAAANSDLATYSSTFRVVGSTQGVDARINTAAADANVPVYWLNGLRVATGHWDFYGNTLDGVTWDNAANGTRSDGRSFRPGYVFTGSVGSGRLHPTGGLGGYRGNVAVGKPSRRPFEAGGASAGKWFPFYGLSGVFQVDPSSAATVQPVLWVSDSTGYEFLRAMFFAVTLDPPATETVTVDYSTVDGSAEAGTDYTATSGTLTFAPGQAWTAVRVEIIDDSVQDSGQTFKLVLSNASNATIADDEGLGKIYNSDPNAQEVSIAAGTSPVTEGTEAEFTLSRTGTATEEALTVTVEVTESGAMLEGTAPAEVTFAAGAETATLTVASADDEAAEAASAVTVTVAAGDGYGVAANATAATVTVADDDAAPEVTTTALAAPENGTAVATLAATDADTAETQLQWTIAGGADAAAFTLSAGGVLAFAAAKDFEWPDDADTDGDYAVTVQVTDGANPVEAALTVSLTDVYEQAPAGTVWSAKMTVVAYGTGAVGAASADLFAHQIGSANLRAKWLWYQPSERKLRLAFNDGLDDAEALTLHLGETTLAFPENSGGDSSFNFEDVDIAWTDGQTLAVRVMDPSAEGAETVTSNAAPAGLPEISGTAQVGETLTASAAAITDADGTENATFAWQWLANDGTDDSEIAGATNATYEAAPADAGKTLKVRVTFTDDKGTAEVLVSAATEAVAAVAPDAPGGLAVATEAGREGELDVSWSATASDGGAEVTGYRVQWKSGAEAYDGSEASVRQAVLGGGAASHTITGLANGTAYAVRVLAVNAAGAGAAAEATATVQDRAAPVLASASVDGTALTVTFSEALDETSKPAAGAFAVTVDDNARGVDAVALSGSAVALTLASAVAAGETVTVGYTVPAGASATPLEDAAGNAAASFAGEAVTNDTPAPENSGPGGPPGNLGHGRGGRDADGVGIGHRGRGRPRQCDVRISVARERRHGRQRDRGRDERHLGGGAGAGREDAHGACDLHRRQGQ